MAVSTPAPQPQNQENATITRKPHDFFRDPPLSSRVMVVAIARMGRVRFGVHPEL
jgi:hypothetical protein